ncbi:MAG: c-type cytochrome [Sterolibacteriaceae bacterium MAG5]|nr:c-type cytochrome [Candidatus Nitricoxidireducens bremensis]
MKSAPIVLLCLGLPVVALAAPPAPQVNPRVKEIVTNKCSLCHGMDGESASAVFPRLAAQHPEYMVKQLADFRDGRRKGTMNEMAAGLTDEEIAGLAAYFGAKKPLARRPGDPDFAAVGKYIFHKGNPYSGVAACASCHGKAAYGTVQLPRLAGQHPAYLETQLTEFNKRERTNDNAIMHAIASKMTELEIKAVAAYIGSLE